MTHRIQRLWIGRVLIGVVLIINIQSAVMFFFHPDAFAPKYELTGFPGRAAIQSLAVLFVMWNVPYAVALIDPIKYRVSLYEAIAMQSIGITGESLIFWSLPLEYIVLRNSILRFILFDGGGLMALITAARITKSQYRGHTK